MQSVVAKVSTVNKTLPDQFKTDEIVNENTAIFCKGRHARVKVYKIYSLQNRITQQTCKVQEMVNSAKIHYSKQLVRLSRLKAQELI